MKGKYEMPKVTKLSSSMIGVPLEEPVSSAGLLLDMVRELLEHRPQLAQ